MADVQHTGHDCKMCGPSWWGTRRGCYIAAKYRYADYSYNRDRLRGYPLARPYEVEYSPGGEPLGKDLPKRREPT